MFILDCSILTTTRRTQQGYTALKVLYCTRKRRLSLIWRHFQHIEKTFLHSKKTHIDRLCVQKTAISRSAHLHSGIHITLLNSSANSNHSLSHRLQIILPLTFIYNITYMILFMYSLLIIPISANTAFGPYGCSPSSSPCIRQGYAHTP